MVTFVGPCQLCPPLYQDLPRHHPFRIALCGIALFLGAFQTACSGGGGSSSNTAPNLVPPAASVSVSPAAATIPASTGMQFVAIVQNSSSAVTWQVNANAGGNTTLGKIDATGHYDAPANVPNPPNVTVTAVLQADTTKSGSATVTIAPPPVPTVSVSPGTASIAVNGTVSLTANVQNSTSPVSWKVNSIAGGNSTIGIIQSSGAFTASYKAPGNVPTPPLVTITALLQADLTVTGSGTITITPAPPPQVSVTVTPPTRSVAVGATAQFVAAVQNSPSGVNWLVANVPGGNATVGTISASGLYTAPATIPNPASISVTAVLQADANTFGSSGVTVTSSSAIAGVFSWRNDSRITGQNQQETLLTTAAVGGGHFGKLFSCAVDGYVYAQPLYVSNVSIPGNGIHNVVYVATEHDSVYAFDADANPCQQIWKISFLDPTAGVSSVTSTDVNTDNITPEIGITGTPVIDPNTGTLYVVAETKENNIYVHRLHARDITTGNAKSSPAVLHASVPGTGDASAAGTVPFQSLRANQRAALLLSGGNVYIAFGSHADQDPYHGWVLAYSATTMAQIAAFSTTPNGSRGGIWQTGAPPSAVDASNVFVVTGNGHFDATNPPPATSDYGQSLLRLQPVAVNGVMNVVDSFTPWNQNSFNANGLDLGATGALLLPDSAGSSLRPHLAIIGGTTRTLYVINRDNLGRFTTGGPNNVLQTLSLPEQLFGTPAYYAGTNAIYMAAAYDKLKEYPLTNGVLAGTPSSQTAATFPFPGASPAISSSGTSDGIVWLLDTSGFGNTPTAVPAVLHAFSAANLAVELYSSDHNAADAAGKAVKFTVPTVANGKVFVGTQTELTVYGLTP